MNTPTTTEEKRAPVQGFHEGIPWDMHLEAYAAYCDRYSPQKALIEGWCRGGFATSELDVFIPGWRATLKKRKEEASEVAQARKTIAEQAAQIVALREALPATLNRAFVRGWMRGHENTVEGTFIPILPPDEATFFELDVKELTQDGSLPELSAALSAPPPPVVPIEDVRLLVEAAGRIRHWHDALYNPETQRDEGMVTSAKAVRALWKTLAEFTAKHPTLA